LGSGVVDVSSNGGPPPGILVHHTPQKNQGNVAAIPHPLAAPPVSGG